MNDNFQSFPFAEDSSFGPNGEFSESFTVSSPKKKEGYWRRIGGGSLLTSLGIHVILILLAIFIIKMVSDRRSAEEVVDFLPGGGGGGKSNSAKLATKRQAVHMTQPKSRIVSTSVTATVVLPDTPNLTAASSLSSFAMPQAGGMGGGEGGLRGSGKGGLLGNGFGTGVGPGRGAGFVAMFGKQLAARRLGIVLDVSKSMHPYLETVVHEANKIGGGAPIVCYYGCGVMVPTVSKSNWERAEQTRGRNFDHFWHCIALGPKPDKDKEVDFTKPFEFKGVYDAFHERKDTYYFEKMGVGYAWLALTAPELRNVDAIYWFADFMDKVDPEELQKVLKELKARKQKLYVHSSGAAPKSLEQVLVTIVKPTGGEQIIAELKKSGPVPKPKKGAKAAK
jgi:hypothetical protein